MDLDREGASQDPKKNYHYYSSWSSNYTPFFPNSVNLISACTSSGKSTLVANFIKNRENCFVREFTNVVVVLCNDKVSGNSYKNLASYNLEVEFCTLNEFIPEQYLDNNYLLIFDDVSAITETIKECVNVVCHHLDLNSIFLIAQSILVDEAFKNLISLVHRVILFFSGGASKKVSKYIRQFYFVNSEIKDCFKAIESYAEKHSSVVLFELNDVNGRFRTKFFSIVDFDVFFEDDESEEKKRKKQLPTLVFPKIMESSDFERSFSDNSTSLSEISDLPPNSFVLVPAKNVVKKSVKREKERKKETDQEKIWNSMNAKLEESIVTGLKYRNQQSAKNLAGSILSCNSFVISSDGKSFKIKDKPKSSVSILDYLSVASRKGGPKEKIEDLFFDITDLLLIARTPKSYFQNKNLLAGRPSTKKEPKIKGRKISATF